MSALVRVPGSAAVPLPEPTCGWQHCITCGDDGQPMAVLAVDEERGLALCSDDQGSHCTVEIALVAPVGTGDRLLVHAGTAIGHLESA
ncbi:MAG TPA: HypC/HybG/HupF family hydrogenase formation chaperone [Solirubrobacteraceae bacterium]|nr:HypC/HybG/HupF family hydrogenase formation chaperone [Solirubrobacteraceae bacterium]